MTEEKQEVEKKPKPQEKPEAKEMAAVKSSAPWPLITIGVFVTIVLLALAVSGWAWMNTALHHLSTRQALQSEGIYPREFGGRSERGERSFGGTMMGTVSGVVTAVNGDTITVGGRGEQVTVKKDDSTVVSGDKSSVAVNDTVIVFGEAGDDDVVTAARIIVRNESAGFDWFDDGVMMPKA